MTLHFIAPSGNHCTILVLSRGNRVVFDAEWDRKPSVRDRKACDEYFAQLPTVAKLDSIVEEDPESLKKITESFLSGNDLPKQ